MKVLRKLLPWLLAAGYLCFAMRGAHHGPAAADGGQHAMNGALIYDYLRTGLGTSPIKFAQSYLVHYPAISVGYHPPVFHVAEAMCFAIFGVSPQSARLTVALFAALSVVLLYSLIRRTHGDDGFALLCVLAFISLRMSQQAASDIMLEFPALFFVLLAMHCLLRFQEGFTWKAALAYAVVSSLAIWTKQHAVFLGLIPFLMVLTTGNWQELKRLPLWGGAALFGVSCLLLAAFMGSVVGDEFKAGSLVSDAGWAQYVVIRNLVFYAWRLKMFFGLPTVLSTVAACRAYLVLRFRQPERVASLALYAAWAAAVIPVPLIAWMNDERYLFGGFPAYVVILLGIVRLAAQTRWEGAPVRWATIISTVLFFGFPLGDYVTYASGPFDAAEYVWQQKPQRVLVCGRGEYQFIFKIRCLAGIQPQMVILRGSKVRPEALRPEEFDQFAHDYGLQYVVIGDDWRRNSLRPKEYAWDALLEQPSQHMQLDEKLPMRNTYRFMEGDMFIYRFTNPSPNPSSELDLQMRIMKRKLKVDLMEPEPDSP